MSVPDSGQGAADVEAALRALREESAEELYESAPCGYLSCLPDGTVARVNRTLLTWLGFRTEQVLGRRLQELFTVGGRIFYDTHVGPLLDMQGFVNEMQFDVVCHDGKALPVLVNLVQKRDAQGRPLFVRASLFNVSDRRRYERELQLARKRAEAAAQAKADFLSLVSHEIRTPMHAVVGLTSLLAKTALSPQQQRYLRLLGASSESLLALLTRILDFSKVESGQVTLEEQRVDLRQLVLQSVYALSGRAEEKQLAVSVTVDEQVPALVYVDPVKLSQVLANVVGNAIKFTEAGRVCVEVLRQAAPDGAAGERVALQFRVTDTGIGIPQDRLAAVFEEFTQASPDIGVRYGGTGLGLTLAQRLLALYDSRLEVSSTEGEGSSFCFTLRLRCEPVGAAARTPPPAAAAASSSAELPEPLQRLDGLRVLVAEDNEINVFVLAQFLRRWGVSFDVVGSGHEAVRRVQEAPYDVVLMDLRMPGLDGYAATRAIRQLAGERYRRLPILAVTASARLGLEERLDDAGFSDFIAKPFKPEDLFAKLQLHSAPHTEPRAAPPPQGQGESMSLPRFDLKRLRALTEDDPAAHAELLRLTLGSYHKHRRGLRAAIKGRDRAEFDYHVHKLRVTVELMQAHGLRTALERARTLFDEQVHAPPLLEAACVGIEHEIDAITEALRQEADAPGDEPE